VAEREAMSRAAREHAARFDLAAIAAQWESLYRELLERAL
jgi:glycosyltransferase involved in cell wall biosynthesis